MSTLKLDNEWKSFMNGNLFQEGSQEELNVYQQKYVDTSSELSISTKTKIAFLSIDNIDILNLYWKLNIIPYNRTSNGIIKKQIKISLMSNEKDCFIEKIDKIKE